ncbi:MAG TPA: bifunctional pyr operon transcriptional regulator/uracil phosphoribosyltransferase, partial [Acidimicrobiia bacterium]
MPQVMNGDDIERAIRRIAHEIIETHRGAERMVIVGLRTRGVHLARRLAATVEGFEHTLVPVGELDVGAYRDDRATRPVTTPTTTIPVDITDRHV